MDIQPVAIKFEPKTPGDGRTAKAEATVEARFATPIEAVSPVNPDAASELPFAKPTKAVKKGRPRR